MKAYRLASCSLLLILLVFGCERPMCGCVNPPLPFEGEWKLVSITYPMTNKTVTAAEAGYTEKLTFTGSGTFLQVRNGVAKPGTPYTVTPTGTSGTEGIFHYSNDLTEQPFRIVYNTLLYLSERTPKGATIADGATYQYQRP
ncbi:hypothetical protein IC229_17965 [Spirosoma sp. BT702]|uniref:Lipocalin-like domain-containing protein n=1 Tax=Spirosoma profusum TaxID=2771354 RepID=A0A927ANT3_9BACT|nr:hypothetical protein [Spirosoma profusum]MBD2702539.1 hypothetical protein [Spirosoma profusum]